MLFKEPYHKPGAAWPPDDDTDKVPSIHAPITPQNWHSSLPNPPSWQGLSNEPPYWHSPPKTKRRIDLRDIEYEKWGFRIIVFVFALVTFAYSLIFLSKIMAVVVAIK
jgi:hypothetical protein